MDIKELPLFPLGIVVFPEESLHLHIFEPRYQQLTHDCYEQGITFGIPPFIDDRMKLHGTELQLVEIVNRYENGRMDIKCEGVRTFRIEQFNNPMQGKLYAGGEVVLEEPTDDSTLSDRVLLIEKVGQLFELMDVPQSLSAEDDLLSFRLGHQIGLSPSQEYQLLIIKSEKKRIEFIIDHLTRTIPMLAEVEKAKKRIKMNGHFKHFNPLKF